MRKILINLLSNAIKFARQASRVLCNTEAKGVEIDVVDEGVGIRRTTPRASRGVVRSPNRSSQARLGLPISGLAQRLDGSLTVNSTPGRQRFSLFYGLM